MRQAAVIKLLLILLLFMFHVGLVWDFFVDDSCITFRYVRQWTHGNGLVYNVGERVEGYSNFLWVALLAPFDLVGLELTLVSKILGVLLGVVTIVVTYYFARRYFPGDFAALLLAAAGPFAAWTVGGLETLLFTCLLTLCIFGWLREEETEKGWFSGILWGLLALTRPEGLLFAFLAVLYRAWRLYHLKTRPQKRDVVRLVSLMMMVVPYFLWRWWYYGYWLPNTVYAKSMGFTLRAPLEGTVYLYQSFVAGGGFFFLVLPLILALTWPKRSLFVNYLATNIGIYAIFMLISGGDWMPRQRFLVHILPLVYLLIQHGLINLSQVWPHRWQMSLITLVVLGQSGYMLATTVTEHRFEISLQQALASAPESQENASITYIKQNLHPGETIAVVDAGGIAYSLPLTVRVIDMVGLTDAHIAHLTPQFPHGLFGRGDGFGKWDVEYILDQKPRFVQIHLIRQTPTGEWVTDFTGATLLINDPRFRTRYRLVDEAGIFERIDTP
ncbi:MAG: glycosyltransferase family 39 protein [Anaerolineae bacterium]|nr:glycosyltransferase family 39 protein [Anaerolineae bacterium]